MMDVICGAKLEIINPSRDVARWCLDNMRIVNPDYFKRLQMGKWTGGTPEYIDLYERIGDSILLPFGAAKRLYDAFPAQMRFRAVYKPLERLEYMSSINLYPYQEAAVEAAQRLKNGIIVMPCGSGKTQTALELVSRIGGKCLWLTHTQDLLNQSLNRAKSVFGIQKSAYGTITDGKVNIGTHLTFATVQTMSKIDLTQYRDIWDIVIVDECHKAVGSPTRVMQFYKVLSNISCRYKYGLTATPRRADGLEKSMFALLGDVVYEVSKEEVSETTCAVSVEFVDTPYKPDLDTVLSGDGTINYAALVDDLTHNASRYDCVLGKVDECISAAKGYTLVLGNRVEYLQRMTDELVVSGVKALCLSTLGNSKMEKQARKSVLNLLNAGEIDCVLATYQLAKEGLDVPNLRYVIFATPEKDETTVVQAAGRVGRKADGKDKGVIIDFVDNGFGMFRGWAKKRKTFYRKMGYFFD